jgi:hypothetical protein
MSQQVAITKQIETETLREWLDTHRPVTVVDVRGDEHRVQWPMACRSMLGRCGLTCRGGILRDARQE